MNIIDTLVIELGFDVDKLSEQQQEAVDSLRKFENAARRNLKPAQEGIDGLVNSFSLLQGRLLAIGGLIAAGLGFNRLVQDVTKLNAETGYLAKNLGVSAQELSKWQNAGATVGAQAGEIASSFAAIRKSMAEFQLTGQSTLNAFAYTTHQTGQGPAVELYDKNGRWRDPTDILLSISRWAEAQENKAVATQMISKLGLGEGMTNLLMQGPDEVQRRLKRGEQFAPTDDQIKKLQELQKAFGEVMVAAEALKTQFVSALAPALTKILNLVADWLGRWSSKQQSIPEAAGEGFGKMGMPELKPDTRTPSLAERSWNWLMGRPGGFRPETVPGYHTRGGADGGGDGSFAGRFGNWTGGQGGGTRPAAGAAGAGGSGGAGGAAGAPGAPGGAGAPAPVSEGGSQFLRDQRQGFTDQLRDPAVRNQVAGMALLEGERDPDRVVESLANRFSYVNEQRAARGQAPLTVQQMLHGGFYGPINRGQLPSAVARINNEPRTAARVNAAIDRVSGGSNLLQGFTDQGLPSDPNGWRFPRIAHGGNVFNDWAGGPGGAAAAAAWRARSQAGVAAEQEAARGRSLPNWLPGVAANANEAGRANSYAPESRATGTDGAGGPGSFNDLWSNRIGIGARGAVMGGDTNSGNTTTTTTTHIGEMHVTPPAGASPQQYGTGIREELQRFDNVQQSNTGLE